MAIKRLGKYIREVMKLRLWSVERLAMELREERLTEAWKFAYMVCSVVLGMVVGNLGLLQMLGQPRGILIWTAAAAVYVGGLVLAFRTNQRGDGVRFVERFICLGVPAYVRMFCLLYGSYLVLSTVGGEWMASNRIPVFYALAVVSYGAFFWWVVRAFSITAGRPEKLAL